MESNRRNLIIGYDLDDECSQISWFNEKKGEPESVCIVGGKNELRAYRPCSVTSEALTANGFLAKRQRRLPLPVRGH